MKLICFPFAGGTISFYNQLKNALVPDVELIAMEYSGHGSRHREPFYLDFSALAADMLEYMEPYIRNNEPYAIMGYSMGSISAVEVLKLIDSRNGKRPCHVFLAAHEPHTKHNLESYTENEIDEFVKERTIQFGAVPEKLIHNRSFWRTYLPLYRADYSIISKYKFEDLKNNWSIPTTVFYSESDTPFEDMIQWNRYFTKSCDFVRYEGNHFFIYDHYEEMAKEIKNRLV